MRTAGGLGGADDERAAVLDKFLELRPTVLARMQAAVPEDLQVEIGAVTPHQLHALALVDADGLTMRALAARLGVSGPAACTLADRLVARGLATRASDPHDRRVVRIVPTPDGHALAARYNEAQRRAIGALLDRLRDDQLRSWLDIMECFAATDERPVLEEVAAP